jgi:GntR family transcriptional regulator
MIKQISQPNMVVRAAEGLREAIREGAFGAAGRLPAEPILSAELGVSRGTVREAVSILEQEGLVFRKQGLGTFVLHALSGLTNNLNANFGVTDMITAAGKAPGTSRLEVSENVADEIIAATLCVAPGSRLVKVERTRTADSQPVAHTTDLLSVELLKAHGVEHSALKARLRAEQSLYGTLRSAGIVIQHGVARLEPVVADASLADRLETPAGTLLFHLDQIDYDATGQPVLASVEHLVAGLLAVRVYRKGPG